MSEESAAHNFSLLIGAFVSTRSKPSPSAYMQGTHANLRTFVMGFHEVSYWAMSRTKILWHVQVFVKILTTVTDQSAFLLDASLLNIFAAKILICRSLRENPVRFVCQIQLFVYLFIYLFFFWGVGKEKWFYPGSTHNSRNVVLISTPIISPVCFMLFVGDRQ